MSPSNNFQRLFKGSHTSTLDVNVQVSRLRVKAEVAAAQAIGKPWQVLQVSPAPAKVRTTYKGIITACSVRQIAQRGACLYAVWDITLRSPSGSKERQFCTSKIPG